MCHQLENGTSHLVANTLTCPIARSFICRTEITFPLCRVDASEKGDGTHAGTQLRQPRAACRPVLARFFVQWLLLLLLMAGTG